MTTSCRQPALLHRLTAVWGVVLVVWLNLLVASPGLHAWLHQHDGSSAGCPAAEVEHTGAPAPLAGGSHQHAPAPVGSPDHHCVVTLFSGGVEALPFLCLLLLVTRPVSRGTGLRPSDWIEGARPRYWHVPALGPPLA